MQDYIDRFYNHLKYERNVSEHTLRNYMSDLEQFHDYLCPVDSSGGRRAIDVRQIDHITIREYLARLYREKRKKTSIARKLATLRTFFKFLCREQVMEANPARLVSSPRLEKKLPKVLAVDDVIRFIETPDTETVLGKRDRAILELLYATGMRVSELLTLRPAFESPYPSDQQILTAIRDRVRELLGGNRLPAGTPLAAATS